MSALARLQHATFAVQPPETFDKIAREPRLSATVADAILQTIVSEQLRAGDALPSERTLEKQFGVSRTVIREAVGALTAKGLLEVKTGPRCAGHIRRR